VAPNAVAANARRAAERAVGLAEDLSEARVSLGLVRYYFSWDWPGAEASFERAVELDPSDPVAHRMLGHVRSQMGRHADGLAAMSRARQLDPFSAVNYALGSQVAFQARRYEEALDLARQATVIDPNFWIGYMVVGQACERLGRIDDALRALGQSARLSAGNSKPVSLEAYVLADAGRTAEAAARLESLLAPPDGRFVPPYAVAIAHAGLGDREAVFAWLERALAARDVHLVFLPVDPKWDPYRDDPRFLDLLDRAGFRFPAPAVAEPSTPS
jgi:tetratricopeptide (TPR) repeat protein